MHPNQRSRYAEQIERAVILLENKLNVGAVPTLDDMASAAAMSSYHFHRVFRVMTGESVGSAITRARLGGSLPLLDFSIMAAAGQSGYSTSQAYARALKDAAGATPSQLRNDAEWRTEVSGSLARRATERNSVKPALELTITALEPLRLATIRNVGDFAELNNGFNRLFACLLTQMAPEDITGLYGIPHDDPREVATHDCRFDCAVTTSSDIPLGIGINQIETSGGLALHMAHVGDYDLIHSQIDRLYREAILADLPIADVPLLIHYIDDPEEVPVAILRADVYLPLRS